jgi:hypothetical protein
MIVEGPVPGPPILAAPLPLPLPPGIETRVCSVFGRFIINGVETVFQACGTTCSLEDAQGVAWPTILLPAQLLRALSGRGDTGREADPHYPLLDLIIGGGNRLGGIRKIWHLQGPGGQYVIDGGHFAVHPRHSIAAPHRKENHLAVVAVDLTLQSKTPAGAAGVGVATQALGGPGGFFSFPLIDPSVVKNINVPLVGAPPDEYLTIGFPPIDIGPPGPAHAFHWGTLSAQTAGAFLLRRSLRALNLRAKHNWRQIPLTDRQYVPEPTFLKLGPGWLKRAPDRLFRQKQDRLPGAGAKRAFEDRPVVPVGEDVLLGDSSAWPAGWKPDYGWAGCPWLNRATGDFVGMDLGHVNARSHPSKHFAASLGGAPIQEMPSRLRIISGLPQSARLVALP